MHFSHDTELTLRAASVLINSDRVEGEQLGDQAALDEYLNAFGWTGRRDHDGAELAAVHALRTRLRRIWESADDEVRAVEEVNALLSDHERRERMAVAAARLARPDAASVIADHLLELVP